MANKSITQLPSAGARQSGDVTIIVRSGVNYQLEVDAMTPPLSSATTVLSSAQVLALNTTPVNVVPNAPAGKVNSPVRALVQFSGGTSDYATNVNLVIGSRTTVGDADYILVTTIGDRTAPIYAVNTGPGKAATGDALAAYVLTGDPTGGDSDLTITTWYQQLDV